MSSRVLGDNFSGDRVSAKILIGGNLETQL